MDALPTKEAISASMSEAGYAAKLRLYAERAKLDIVETSTALGLEKDPRRQDALARKLQHAQEVSAFVEERLKEHEEATRRDPKKLLVVRVIPKMRGYLVMEAISLVDSEGRSIINIGVASRGTTRILDADLHAAYAQKARVLIFQEDGGLLEWAPAKPDHKTHAPKDTDRILTRAIHEAMS